MLQSQMNAATSQAEKLKSLLSDAQVVIRVREGEILDLRKNLRAFEEQRDEELHLELQIEAEAKLQAEKEAEDRLIEQLNEIRRQAAKDAQAAARTKCTISFSPSTTRTSKKIGFGTSSPERMRAWQIEEVAEKQRRMQNT